MDYDTIAAISTPIGEGAISIVRLSGPEAVHVADRLFHGRRRLVEVDSHTIHYGKIVDPETGRTVEEVMVSVMRKPKTFTREDVVEINCHGGLTSVNRVLELILDQDVRLAEPGEFTKRAFLNGRIDLSQAEAVMDLIRAKTDQAMNVAIGQMEGKLSQLVRQLRQQLLDILAAVEVNIDYPEYDDAEVMTNQLLIEKGTAVRKELERVLATARQGKILREGLSTVIVGRPNVGKSSLLNQLVHESKAIVTNVPGTTRDVIEEYVNVRGVPLKLVDTAGIRDTEDVVEKIGVSRSKELLKSAELVLLLINGNEPLTEEDRQLFQLIVSIPAIILMNKADLPQQASVDEVKALAGDHPILQTSMVSEKGLEELEQAIANLFFSNSVASGGEAYVSNTRHIALLKQAHQAINDAIAAAEQGIPVDMTQIDIKRSWDLLGEIVGDTVSDRLINELFSKFCLGK
ncbi:tRNA uridine-5-carboxymethylaminomethyl(34) synthesis GTPase MnmE [Sporolactobacillus terrae]|uniref:tRNA modification GTPase MnmE n=1 Tax=Sporolactobacillus terrae TaxID=269673 RepID=A0A410DCV5_9BACL|nr:tRNA uridine-5-carboxymethylaminomethyl(34) synthesis GTPase MnmE [Sporolactobacillus terrae]QAA23909.1 tRNA uridine-5-carboxymethylaminomethyl(34) synthesis GTPase MnmE [Sporolactobacillus terrae]QAA26879.1 tRNA uridine-5-carboxymethylaminomethyl(34) synthesis GTPase MnmE [Sporolactobacillus terrae]UAK15939.1 tRNA uridine-5-carboxymethylaminomethyl(34) synthesis GTPase MnmE [Sporolactobacillus terrae]BBO00447.1 tRNA modification GTPase MnmE [Sporolactobacillus terrae]